MGYGILMLLIMIGLIAVLKWKAIIVIVIIFVIGYFLPDNDKENVKEEKREKIMIPRGLKLINYYGGYNRKLSGKLFFENRSNGICLYDRINNLKVLILKRNILNFSMNGEYHRDAVVSGGEIQGGGSSIGGAIVGEFLDGPSGAIIGSRKKVTSNPIKTEINVTDTRKIILKFKENEQERGMILDKSIWDDLCFLCPEKKIK
ncbi:hypothetical protein KYB31_07950 [Clostridium felsineum]|uniref:hypothetical protein n=1 Tax=Clostridium felsineum TaxID=36839 RepID=UPI00098CC36A|nr:hypothetical protein [Clostridium felsineum]MCR3758922.1 hypothetical protein [Clostridium felsineum]URZ14070.1 hypothetical protein CLFE_000450 [Clostridium felsineum DSM 794]